MLLWGAQLGWYSLGGNLGIYDQIIQPQFANQRTYIGLLVKYRKLASNYLLYGRMMRDLFYYSPVEGIFSCKTNTVSNKFFYLLYEILIDINNSSYSSCF